MKTKPRFTNAKVEELVRMTQHEKLYFFEKLLPHLEKLNAWEKRFVLDVFNQGNKFTITARQIQVGYTIERKVKNKVAAGR